MAEPPDGTRWGHTRAEIDGPLIDVPAVPKQAHVWVNTLEAHIAHRVHEYPGLIIGWRRGTRSWQAQVVYTVPSSDGQKVAAHIAWFDAHQLRPV